MRKQLIASVVLLLLTNVVVLAGVFYNRSGGPLFSIELTERELPLVQSIGFDDENSGTGLLLRWQIPMAKEVPEYFYNTYSTPVWLDDAKIIELGFDIEKYNSDTEKYQTRTSHLSREVVMVLEYQGDSYQRAIALAEKQLDQAARDATGQPAGDDKHKKLEDAEKRLAQLKTSGSRLYAVDAGVDKEALIQKYADKHNYLLAHGEIGLKWSQGTVSGRIRQIYLSYVHAPLPLSEQLVAYTNGKTYSAYDQNTPPRYSLRLNIGKRLEPWIESVSKID